MKKKITTLLLGLLVCLLLVPALGTTAYAKDYDEIVSYDVAVQPNVEDGSLNITVTFDWKALEELPYDPTHTDTNNCALKVGIPNGSIRDVQALTDNIEELQFDNRLMYIFLDRKYNSGETFHFAYSWVQEYMYTLGSNGSVSYDYTPGWFDEAKVDRMTVTWLDPQGVGGNTTWSVSNGNRWSASGNTVTGTNLPHGEQIRLETTYASWPVALSPENSSSNVPEPDPWGGNSEPYYPYEEDNSGRVMFYFILVMIIVVFLLVQMAARNDRYSGGFGTHYVFYHNLWYPAGPDGKPKPGSTGLAHKPKTPASTSSHSSGFGGSGLGGGKRGGGFGGGGFGGGSHCACASSCACACACACAGGGRAGCSAKNLYGAIHLDGELTRRLEERTEE